MTDFSGGRAVEEKCRKMKYFSSTTLLFLPGVMVVEILEQKGVNAPELVSCAAFRNLFTL